MLTHDQDSIEATRDGVWGLRANFNDGYWRAVDEKKEFPEEFATALTEAGWLAAMIPEEYGDSGFGLTEPSVILEEVNCCGCNSGTVHGQMYNMFTLLRHGSEEQKRKYLSRIASGELRLQSMAVTEPSTGTDTTKVKTAAVRKGDKYVINEQKVWISRIQHFDLMIVLARTTPVDQVTRKSLGMSIFLVDLHHAIGMTAQPIPGMVNHETNELFFDNLEIPAECIGDSRWFINKASQYACDRGVFGRPIGKNQGVQLPIAQAHINVEAADFTRWRACYEYDNGQNAGASVNMAKYLAA
jgi:acyl-CoA dehydrogenase